MAAKKKSSGAKPGAKARNVVRRAEKAARAGIAKAGGMGAIKAKATQAVAQARLRAGASVRTPVDQKIGGKPAGTRGGPGKLPATPKRSAMKGATPRPSAQGDMKRKGLKFQGATVRNVQKNIGGVTGRQKSQSIGTARPKTARTGPMTSMVNQQARIKREMARGNVALRRADGTKRAAGQTQRIQGKQRKVEEQFRSKMKHHATRMASALKKGDSAKYQKHQAAHRELRQGYRTFVKGGRKVGQGG